MSLRSLSYDKSHPSMKRERQKRYRLKLRHDAIVAYGGACYECRTTREDVIEFDHTNGNGNAHRSALFHQGHASPGGWMFYLWLKKCGYPKDIDVQLLCIDCHDEKHPERKGKERKGAPAQSHKDAESSKGAPF
jgi:hypothetical protein